MIFRVVLAAFASLLLELVDVLKGTQRMKRKSRWSKIAVATSEAKI